MIYHRLTRITRAILRGWTPPMSALDWQLSPEVRIAAALGLHTNPATQQAAVIFRAEAPDA